MTFTGSPPFLEDLFGKTTTSTKGSDPPAPSSSTPGTAVVSQPDDPNGDRKPSASDKSTLKDHAKDDDISVDSDADLQEKAFLDVVASKSEFPFQTDKKLKAPPPPARKTSASRLDKDAPPDALDKDGFILVDDEIGDDAINDNPSSSFCAGAYRHEFYFTQDFHLLGNESLEHIFSKLEKVDPIDWCDSFLQPFHVALTRDPTLWSQVYSSFNRLSSSDDLHVWLTSKMRGNPLAFLGSSRGDRPAILFHNLCCPADCGTIVEPETIFYGLNCISFETMPFQIESDDIPLLLSDHVFSQVPTFAEILEHCVVEIKDFSPSSSFPHLSFDPSKFKTFTSSSSSSVTILSELQRH